VLAALEDGRASDQCGGIAIGALHQAIAAGREVVNKLGRVQLHPLVIDNVDVGAFAGRQSPATVKAKEIGGLTGQALDDKFERQTRAAFAIARPMDQHLARHAGIDDLHHMHAAIAEPEEGGGIGQHLPDGFVIVASVARHRKEQEIAGILPEIVVGGFGRRVAGCAVA
jgi:hypothetical protein